MVDVGVLGWMVSASSATDPVNHTTTAWTTAVTSSVSIESAAS